MLPSTRRDTKPPLRCLHSARLKNDAGYPGEGWQAQGEPLEITLPKKQAENTWVPKPYQKEKGAHHIVAAWEPAPGVPVEDSQYVRRGLGFWCVCVREGGCTTWALMHTYTHTYPQVPHHCKEGRRGCRERGGWQRDAVHVHHLPRHQPGAWR